MGKKSDHSPEFPVIPGYIDNESMEHPAWTDLDQGKKIEPLDMTGKDGHSQDPQEPAGASAENKWHIRNLLPGKNEKRGSVRYAKVISVSGRIFPGFILDPAMDIIRLHSMIQRIGDGNDVNSKYRQIGVISSWEWAIRNGGARCATPKFR